MSGFKKKKKTKHSPSFTQSHSLTNQTNKLDISSIMWTHSSLKGTQLTNNTENITKHHSRKQKAFSVVEYTACNAVTVRTELCGTASLSVLCQFPVTLKGRKETGGSFRSCCQDMMRIRPQSSTDNILLCRITTEKNFVVLYICRDLHV